jgi:uncharacterized protein
MPDQPLVSVRGETVLEVEPEIATVSVTLMARDATPDEVLARLRERSQRMAGMIERFGSMVEKVETAAVRVIPEFKDGKPKERIVGYVGELRTTITVGDFTYLGELVGQTSRGDLIAVSGPWWSLRHDSSVFRRSRELAVEDAVRRAREYADALGCELTGLLELADVGLSTTGWGDAPPAGPRPLMAATANGAAANGVSANGVTTNGSGGHELNLEPARQTVRAQVEARFRMSAPDLTPRGRHSIPGATLAVHPSASNSVSAFSAPGVTEQGPREIRPR